MDIMTLAAKLILDDSGYKQGIAGAEKSGQQLAKSMGAMTVAVGNIAADMIQKGASAVKNLVSNAVGNFANYQQLVGGVETLFKTSSDKVLKYAKQSYKTTGLSANQYMETVTSFSASLLQGLGGDVEAAADLANTAIIDMADNANKMGTDMQSIQNAYQGFAKQNYTMLDNLKLGYGGTASEMVRLINDSKTLDHEISDLDGITFNQIIAAIHAVQQQIGITGTTSQEAADTITGSKAAFQAAWQDFLTAVGGAGDSEELDAAMQKFKGEFAGYMNNFIPQLVGTLGNSGNLITAIADSIATLPTDIITQMGEGAAQVGTDALNGLTKLTGWLIDSLVNMFANVSADNSQIEKFGEALGNFLGTTVSKIVANGGTIFKGIIDLGAGLAGGLIEGLFKGLFGEGAEVDKIGEKVNETLTDAEVNHTKASALIQYLTDMIEKEGKVAQTTDAWKKAAKELDDLLPGATKVIWRYGNDVDKAREKLEKMNNEQRRLAVEAAFTKAHEEQYELLGTQTAQRELLAGDVELAQYEQQETLPNLVNAIKAAAAQKAEEYKTAGENGGFFDEDIYKEFQNLAKGLTEAGGEMVDLSELDFTQLEYLVRDLGNEDLSQYFKSQKEVYNQAQITIDSATAKIAELDTQIAATEEAIARTDKAMERAMQKYAADTTSAGETVKKGADSAKSDIQIGGQSVKGGLEAVGDMLSSWNPLTGLGGGFHPQAVGMDYVPYDGFRSELHRGEMVLTKAEANAYRNGASSADVVLAIQGLSQELQNMKIMVGRRTFGRAVVDYGGNRVDDYIGQAESRYYSGYGT